jgi:hypothetical protein
MYLLLSNPSLEYAESISRELWLLVRPDPGGVTLYYAHIAKSPDQSGYALLLPDESMPIDPDADPEQLIALIDTVITEDEKTSIRDGIQANKGGNMNLRSFVSVIDSLSSQLKTREQLEADGWFASTDPA